MRRSIVLVSLVSLMVALVPLPASAQSEIACPPGVVPSSGFTDVDPSSVHKLDINLILLVGQLISGVPSSVPLIWQRH